MLQDDTSPNFVTKVVSIYWETGDTIIEELKTMLIMCILTILLSIFFYDFG
jgi:hypothetical protein